MTKHDQERRDALLRYIAKVELQITKEYGKTCQLIGQIHELRKAVESNDDFAWEKHPEIRNKMHVLLDRFARRTANTLTVATSTAYDMGLTDGTNKTVEAYSSLDKTKRKSVKDIARKCLNEHRKGGKEAHAYATAKRGGLTISDRVWNLTKGTEKEIEICVQNAILLGGDAADLSREIRGYLNNPKALFRRVRNPKTGNLELSKAAQNYHPGQGVYRSAYLNAMRLTRTEINQAYRTAETASYADNPLITGYRIRLSDNHTTLFKGKRIPLVDICDYLAGEYPATFKWNGWHPQCRCIIVPNALSEDDLDTLIQARGEAIEEGRDPNGVLKGLGRNPDLPDNFINWFVDNEDRIKAAKYRPLWLGTRVARRASAQIEKPNSAPKVELEPQSKQNAEPRSREEILAAAKERHEARTDDQIRDIQDRADVRTYGQEYVYEIHELEKTLGIKRGKRMTDEEADMQNANPKYKKTWIKDDNGRWIKNPDKTKADEQYGINCATCSPTYELRRRGFKITAKGNPGKEPSLNYEVSKGKSFQLWKNADGTAATPSLYEDWMEKNGFEKMTPKRYEKFFEEHTKEDGVYLVTIRWKSSLGGAHATILRRVNGKLYYVEPQVYDKGEGALRSIDRLCNNGHSKPSDTRGIMRIDDKIFDKKWAKLFDTK